ncbi:MAG: PDZ domain-containing protein, partial [bacterium]|nr:PDZ domain-containing protein [bacterium]
SPADKAHLQEGDIILEYNGKVINKDNTLSKMINDSRIGDNVMLKVLRGATTTNFSVTLDERPENL